MPEQYLDKQHHQLENYFFNGNLLGVKKYGDDNQTLLAISPHGYYQFNYIYYPSVMICNSNDAKSGQYEANMILKSTDCPTKMEYQNDLLYCQTNFHYNIEIKKPLFTAEQQQNYFYLLIFLVIIIFVLVYIIKQYSKKYSLIEINIIFRIQ